MLRGVPSSAVMPAGRRATSRASRRAQRRRRARRRLLLVGTACIVLVAGATAAWAVTRDDGTDGSAAPTTSTSTSTTTVSTAPTTSTTTRDPIRGNGEAVTFAFGGDVHFEGALRAQARRGPERPARADRARALGRRRRGRQPRDRRSPTAVKPSSPRSTTSAHRRVALDALKTAGVDAVSLANNHGLDFGVQGLADTLAAGAERQYPVIGIGNNAAEALTPLPRRRSGAAHLRVRRHRRHRLAVRVRPGPRPTPGRVWRRRSSTDSTASWRRSSSGARSPTRSSCSCTGASSARPARPTASSELAQALIDAGADIVVGGHAHRVQGAGLLGTGVRRLRARQLRLLQRERGVRPQRRAPGDRDRARHRRVPVGPGAHPRRRRDAAAARGGRGRRARATGTSCAAARARGLTAGRP